MSGWRKLTALAALAAFSALAGCGTDDGPKRAVDPQSEVLRFYPAGTDVVALVDTDVQLRDLRALSRAASPVPGWPELRRRIDRVLDASGLSVRRQIAPLLGNRLAVGAGTLGDLAEGRPLLALEARDSEQLEAVLGAAAAAGGIDGAGRYRRAALYRAPAAALAARDGVLLAGADLDQLRRALDVRDGDDDARLDDDTVGEILDELPPEPGIHAYLDLGRVLDERLGADAQRRVDRIPWAAALGRAGLSLALRHDSATLAFLARPERGSVEDSDLPIAPGEQPPRLHRVARGLTAGLRGAGQAERFARRTAEAIGREVPATERFEALIATISRGGPATDAQVEGAAGSLALDGGLRDALRAAGVLPATLRRIPPVLDVSGYASATTDELHGRIELSR
jgi:hypothetical protein